MCVCVSQAAEEGPASSDGARAQSLALAGSLSSVLHDNPLPPQDSALGAPEVEGSVCRGRPEAQREAGSPGAAGHLSKSPRVPPSPLPSRHILGQVACTPHAFWVSPKALAVGRAPVIGGGRQPLPNPGVPRCCRWPPVFKS